MKLFLGSFPVVESKLGGVTIDLGRNVHITVHLNMAHRVPNGTMLPLYSEVDDAFLRNPDSKSGS